MMFNWNNYVSLCDYTPQETVEDIYYKLMRRVVGTKATRMAFAELAEMAASGTEEERAAAKLVMRDIYER